MNTPASAVSSHLPVDLSMRFRVLSRLLSIALLSMALPAAALAQARVIELEMECGIDQANPIDVFDPGSDPEKKRPLLQTLEAGAARGCVYDGYVVGTMLRHGRALPGNPLERDTARAGGLIEAYARSGNITAFADLAEMALAEGDARNAMKWTQVYLHLAMQHAPSKTLDFDRRGYNANLLVRATLAWQKARLKRSQIETLLNEYLAAHRAEILEGLAAGPVRTSRSAAGEPNAPPLRAKNYQTTHNLSAPLRVPPGYALFLLEVQPSGHVSRIVPETFGPAAETPAALKPLIEHIAFEPFDASEPQIARVPVVYGYGNGGPSLRVPH